MSWGRLSVPEARRRIPVILLVAAVVSVGCAGGDAGVAAPGDQGGDDSGQSDSVELDVTVEEGEEDDDFFDDLPPDPEYVEVTATGPLEGQFSSFPACSDRNDEGGGHLHVFFSFSDESRDEVPSIDVVMKLRPFHFVGDFDLSGDDLEVEFRHGDFSHDETLDAAVTGTVQRAESGSGVPLAVVTFDGEYDGDIGIGTFQGELTCFAVPDE